MSTNLQWIGLIARSLTQDSSPQTLFTLISTPEVLHIKENNHYVGERLISVVINYTLKRPFSTQWFILAYSKHYIILSPVETANVLGSNKNKLQLKHIWYRQEANFRQNNISKFQEKRSWAKTLTNINAMYSILTKHKIVKCLG